jgi:putative thiazole/oxazole-modified microcin (TOMM)-like peptide
MLKTIDTVTVEQDWRFAELIAQTWTDPTLADRYAADPCAVLAEFGLTVTDRTAAPLLPSAGKSALIIERLDAPVFTMNGTGGFCVNDADFQDVPRRPAASPTRS